jgi:hypothetical protein
MPNETVDIYEDDPASGTLTKADVPDIKEVPFAFKFDSAEQIKDPIPGSVGFRYWNAAAALRRGVKFWAPVISIQKWHRGDTPLAVFLDKGEELNSNYDRQSLNFYHRTLRTRGQPDVEVFASASPDLLCHELGHAMLDSIKPELFNTNSHEIAAFHECFGDMSAILCSLQIPSLRKSILEDTGGHLFTNSRLSRIAEQFGAALRAEEPGSAEPDCLRNAFNPFNYADPTTLQNNAPATGLSSDPHSFSRIFTGALFEAMAGMLAAVAAGNVPTPENLLKVTEDMRYIIVAGVKATGVVPNYFAQVATSMVQESASVPDASGLVPDRDYSAILRPIFVRRGIISMQTASAVMSPLALNEGGIIARLARGDIIARLARGGIIARLARGNTGIAKLPSSRYGLDAPLLVRTPSSPGRFIARSAMPDSRPMEPLSPTSAARAYVDELFANDQVQIDPIDGQREGTRRPKSHYLLRIGRHLHLERLSFN